ncbi:hypothetical protein RclHR1_06290002 [Rhizophagus clarus]|uniref:Uncharacterized protein n=1 Tax=Rhizophagus clarus TaxID=94130 RepID=A0A2Z6SI04_9GLOM|nr:hypothetical protein RclHR1_06290002 [Rhizophagus clarus]GES83267.1 hypothetical protein GLOIN_2v1843401 [Rhizophagus clarus]
MIPLSPLLTSPDAPELFEIGGNNAMKVFGIVITLPPPDSDTYKNYFKCNNFCIFRILCTEALREYDIDPKEISCMAADCWNRSSKDFKAFFTEYSKAIFNVRKSKVIRIKDPYVYNAGTTKRKPRAQNRKKPSKTEIQSKEAIKELYVGQEDITMQRCQDEINNFEIIRSPQVEFSSFPAYSYYTNDVKTG